MDFLGEGSQEPGSGRRGVGGEHVMKGLDLSRLLLRPRPADPSTNKTKSARLRSGRRLGQGLPARRASPRQAAF